jgi:methylmalonyl-CoA/ethylmalonyl-CoA epimerase
MDDPDNNTVVVSSDLPDCNCAHGGCGIRGIDHIAVAVENLDEAIDWYVNGLGFCLLEQRTTRGESTGMLSAILRAGEITVVLIQGTCPRSQVSRFIQEFGPGVQHVAFEVMDIDTALKHVKGAGGTAATHVIQDRGIRQVFLQRDAGSAVRVELIEKRGGTFSDRTVEELFRRFEADGLY